MNRLGYFLLNIAVALYLFANGILGLNSGSGRWTNKGEFFTMVNTIFKNGNKNFIIGLTIVLSVCAIVAGVFLLLSIFRNNIAITELILLVFIILWVIFIVIVDIYMPIFGKSTFVKLGIIQPNPMVYLTQLAAHLMVLGALISSTRRFGNA
jgi:uncharacterized membrane protein YozB (DUF420 family)